MWLVGASMRSHAISSWRSGRCFSSGKVKRITRKHQNNIEMKQLYGAVKTNEKISDDETPFDENLKEHPAITESQSLRATEVHWMLGTIPANRVRLLQTSPKTSSPSSESSVQIESREAEHTDSPAKSRKHLLRKFITLERNYTSDIPFDETGLKSILRYPLVGQKATTAQMDEAMKTNIPSISKILTATMPEVTRKILKKWKLGKIAELGEEGFREYEQLTLNTGTMFHSSIQDYFEKEQVPDESSPVYKLWQSIGTVLAELDPQPVLMEKSIVHPELKYKGIIDSVAVINDKMYALEWKTSEKMKPRLSSTFDAPIQLCAYIGALNADPRYEITTQNGYVVVAYKNGTRANAFCLHEKDVRKYWSVWLQRVQEYWIRTRDGTIPDPI